MNNMRIIEIPASIRESAGRKNAVRKLRVAAYCRVSTEEEEQQGSFEIQKLYYTEKIESTPEWEVAGIYADDGISGVHTKKRDGLQEAQNRPYPDEIYFPVCPQYTGQHPIRPNAETDGNCVGI